eukprot:gene319-1778_t
MQVAPTAPAPTTAAPPTAALTTPASTTAAPTPGSPTTVAPTTMVPTTPAPTTVAPSRNDQQDKRRNEAAWFFKHNYLEDGWKNVTKAEIAPVAIADFLQNMVNSSRADISTV